MEDSQAPVAVLPDSRPAKSTTGRSRSGGRRLASVAAQERRKVGQRQLLSFANHLRLDTELDGAPWKVLVVDDAADVHEVTKLVLDDFRFQGRPLVFLSSYSAMEAMALIQATKDVAVVLLDVVMEREDAGLRVIRHIRRTLGISDTRIILRTGHPGYAPEREIVREFDINDYLEKTEVTSAKLATSMYSALRSYRDIRALRKQREDLERLVQEVSHAAARDGLTGLVNRVTFWHRLQEATTAAQRVGTYLGMMLIDLDDFKAVNDLKGHAVGDAALREVAKRLRRSLRKPEVVARLGGDEFGVILTGLGSPSEMKQPAERVLEQISKPIDTNEGTVSVSCSIGLTCFPDDADEAEGLLRCADLAMYQAKREKKARFRFYDDEIHHRMRQRTRMETILRTAVEQGLFEVAYQPIVDLADGKVIRFEALVRLRSGDGTLLLPERFIQIAEEVGLIEDIDQCVIDRVCRDLRKWRDQGIPPLTVAVNLSAQDFQSRTLAGRISEVLERHDLAPGSLEIEITESALVMENASFLEQLEELRTIGISLTVDDFGTGYSSLGRLRRLPVSKLKIDRSFVADILASADAEAIVGAILSMSDSLHLRVVAEGIERPEQADWLRSRGCSEGQGFHFGKPVPAERLDVSLGAV